MGFTQLLLDEEWMQLDLVDCRNHRGAGDEVVQMLGAEVANTDCPDTPLGEQALGGLVRGDCCLKVCRHWPVQEVQIEMVETELAQAPVEGVQGSVEAVVAHPELGRDEDLRTVDAAAPDTLADFGLVHVGGRCVDQSVSAPDRGHDGLRGLLRAALVDAKAEGRHGDTVVQHYNGTWFSHDEWLLSQGFGAGQRAADSMESVRPKAMDRGPQVQPGGRAQVTSSSVATAMEVVLRELSGGVFLVGDQLHPIGVLAVLDVRDRDVAHAVGVGRAMPVLDPGRDPHDVAGLDLLASRPSRWTQPLPAVTMSI